MRRSRSMNEYAVESDFDNWFPLEGEERARTEDAIVQLVTRYGLAGGRVLSVGGGRCREERFFLSHGCSLVVVDIDEQGLVEPFLQQAPSGPVRYLVGDAGDAYALGKFDLIYFSGFTPDEERRDALARRSSGPAYDRMVEAIGAYEWPWWEDPFHPVIITLAAHLRRRGVLIVQSYCGGLDILSHRYYLWACDRQLSKARIRLCEVYRFSQTTGVCLYVATRGNRDMPLSTHLTIFHGRAQPEPLECIRIAGPPKGAQPPGA